MVTRYQMQAEVIPFVGHLSRPSGGRNPPQSGALGLFRVAGRTASRCREDEWTQAQPWVREDE